MDIDYRALGLVAGIEIHQQLDTGEKLFCRCPTVIRDAGEHTGTITRYLRATESELGEIDRAAAEEMMQNRLFSYLCYDTTCLVENDEEPPGPLNPDALNTALTIAKMVGMTYISQIHTMRKLVIDGSNTSGFQRTAMVASDGILPDGGKIETICVEEEAAQRIEGNTFSLDRLGIPLIEITTSPCLHTPSAVKETAAYIGMILRSTGRVKRGIGTIRQDINISIRDGARVEIKGVQELDLIEEVVKREVMRQVNLLAIREELIRRNACVRPESIPVTDIFARSQSTILTKAKEILAIKLDGFAGLVGREIQPGRRLGSELSDYAKKCGVGGLFHTDELPAYGVSLDEVNALRERCGAGEQDAVIIVADTKKRTACAIQQIAARASMAFVGVPEETRKMLEDGSTAYMRPLPGAARMYPETDVMPVVIDARYWDDLFIPELLIVKAERFCKDYNLDPAVAKQMAYSEYSLLFETAVRDGIKPALASRTLLATLKELSRQGILVQTIPNDAILEVLMAVRDTRAAKEAVPDILAAIAGGMSVPDAVEKISSSVSREGLDTMINAVVAERIPFIHERGMGAVAPIMGVVMKEVRGSVDGKVVNEAVTRAVQNVLRKEI